MSVYVLMRVLHTKDGTAVRFPVGVFTDKADADKAARHFQSSMTNLHPAAAQLLTYLGLASVSGVIVEQSFTAGAGIELPPPKSLIIPG